MQLTRNGVLGITNQRFLLTGSLYNKGKRKRLYYDKSNAMSESAHTCALELGGSEWETPKRDDTSLNVS